ncbi:hypothetical protein D1007_10233 [Hordeum vulgare]|nr:hypothetical protein D1007_10233 [Hordeum vulgare]
MDTNAWQELLESIALHEPDIDWPDDRISWRSEPSLWWLLSRSRDRDAINSIISRLRAMALHLAPPLPLPPPELD